MIAKDLKETLSSLDLNAPVYLRLPNGEEKRVEVIILPAGHERIVLANDLTTEEHKEYEKVRKK